MEVSDTTAALTAPGTSASDSAKIMQIEVPIVVYCRRNPAHLRFISIPLASLGNRFHGLTLKRKRDRLLRYSERVLLMRHFDKVRSDEIAQELLDRKLELWGYRALPDGTLVSLAGSDSTTPASALIQSKFLAIGNIWFNSTFPNKGNIHVQNLTFAFVC